MRLDGFACLFGCTRRVELRAGWPCCLGPFLRVARAVGGWRPIRVSLGQACCGLTGGFLLLRNFGVATSVGPHVCFVLVLVLVSVFLGWCICWLGVFRAGRTTKCLRSRGRTGGEGWSTAN